jgi:hypothetical protein
VLSWPSVAGRYRTIQVSAKDLQVVLWHPECGRMKISVSYCTVCSFERTYRDWQASHGPPFSL